MRILFSPVGTADPLTILGDGSMLHIIRHYQPQRIVLFLTPQMAEYEHEDSRYTRAIALLSEREGGETPEVDYVRSAYQEVYRYDHYIEEFVKLLGTLRGRYPDAEIIVNMSSGTAALQSALVAIDAFDRFGLHALQVKSPANGINGCGDREDPNNYDLDSLWALDPDNMEDRPNRCIEVESAHFNDLMIRDNVRALIENYNYAAASHMACQGGSIPEETCELIKGCEARSNLNTQQAVGIFSGTEFAYDPANLLPEYLWSLEVILKQERWADYLRAMTPALFETLHKTVLGRIPDDAWLVKIPKGDGNFQYRIDSEKVNASSELRNVLITQDKHNPFLSNGYLVSLATAYCNESEAESFRKLRNLEEGARHPLAHMIQRISRESLEQAGGMKLAESMALLFELNDVAPGLYSRINKAILDSL